MVTENVNNNFEEQESSLFQFAEIWKIIVLNWYWILISVIVALGAAHAYLKYADHVYSHSISMLIKDQSTTPRRAGSIAIEGIVSNTSGFENELEILKSTSINTRVVKTLRLYASYWIEGSIKRVELYNKETPIIVDMPENQLENLRSNIELTITTKGEGYNVVISYPMAGQKAPVSISKNLKSLPAEISTPMGTILLQKNPNAELGSQKLIAYLRPLTATANSYRHRLVVAPSNKTTTLAKATMNDTKTARAIDYLNELFNSYNIDANEDKNEVATKTENFIKERLDHIRSELDSTEINIEVFKKDNELFDVRAKASEELSGTHEYERKMVELQMQTNLLNALYEYINDPAHRGEAIPANLGLSDAGLNAAIKEYNEYVIQRKRLLKSSSEDNPMVQRTNSYIEEMWPTIQMSIDAIRRNMAIQKENIDSQYKKYQSRFSTSPSQERKMNNIARQQEIKASLYLMLLQKQEENYISLASTAAKARIIDDAQCTSMVAPKTSMIYMTALGVGAIAPVALLFLISLLRYNIEGREDVEKLTKASILSDIPLSHKQSTENASLVVRENTNDMMEEAFRGLRTNLRFVLDQGEKVILATSCVPGEGKTFISTNLAMSLALMGKKVILVGLDIRKPRLVKLFNLSNNKSGITSFLTSESDTYDVLDEQIQHGICNENLDILPAGIIPPNPSELVSREKLDLTINLLKEHYDYVILDTPPVGLVSDTLSIGRVADMTLFVCRADYSPKSNFALINALINDKKLPKVNIVLNGIDLKRKKYGYYYGYGKYGRYSKYGYGKYGYGKYGHYGHYGLYGNYGNQDGKSRTEK